MIGDPQLAHDWLTWWHHGYWWQADDSWRPPRFAALPVAQQQGFLQQHASVWQHALAIPDTPIGTPQPLVLALTNLPMAGREQLLMVMAEITGCATALPSEVKIWCRRLAKALRPDSWLPPHWYAGGDYAHSLRLLQALWPTLWPRLKLLFPQATVIRCEAGIAVQYSAGHDKAANPAQSEIAYTGTVNLAQPATGYSETETPAASAGLYDQVSHLARPEAAFSATTSPALPATRLYPLLEAALWQCQRQYRNAEQTCVET